MEHKYFQVDWFDYKRQLLAEFDPDSSKHRVSKNARSFHESVTAGDSWRGYTRGQMAEWLKTGYMPDEVIRGLAEIVPQTENRTSIDWNEEDGEFHLDLAYSGADDYFSLPVQEKRAYGVRIEAGIMFSSSVSNSVITSYMVWVAKVLWTLESQGINCSLLLDFPSVDSIIHPKRTNSYGASNKPPIAFHNLVQVKRENESSDFLAWSAMVSPAALRNFGFGLIDSHADALGWNTSKTYGRGMRDRTEWKITYDADRRVIEIVNPYSGISSVPVSKLDAQLETALEQMRESQ